MVHAEYSFAGAFARVGGALLRAIDLMTPVVCPPAGGAFGGGDRRLEQYSACARRSISPTQVIAPGEVRAAGRTDARRVLLNSHPPMPMRLEAPSVHGGVVLYPCQVQWCLDRRTRPLLSCHIEGQWSLQRARACARARGSVLRDEIESPTALEQGSRTRGVNENASGNFKRVH